MGPSGRREVCSPPVCRGFANLPSPSEPGKWPCQIRNRPPPDNCPPPNHPPCNCQDQCRSSYLCPKRPRLLEHSRCASHVAILPAKSGKIHLSRTPKPDASPIRYSRMSDPPKDTGLLPDGPMPRNDRLSNAQPTEL